MQPAEKHQEIRALEPKVRAADKEVLRDALRDQGERVVAEVGAPEVKA